MDHETSSSPPLQSNATPEPVISPPPTKSSSKLPWILVVLLLLIIVGVGGMFLGKQMTQSNVVTTMPTVWPTPDLPVVPNLANWKTFTNADLSFKYPSDWKEIDSGRFEGGVNSSMILYVVGKDSTLMNECMKRETVIKTPNAVVKYFSRVSGGVSEACSGGTDDPHDLEAWIISGDESYAPGLSFSYNHDDTDAKAILDQILSTFKFTDQKNTVEDVPTALQTFLHPDYPFQVTYPKNWNLRTTYGKSVTNTGNSRIAGVDISNNLSFGSTVIINVIDSQELSFGEWVQLHSGRSGVPKAPNYTYLDKPAYRFEDYREGRPPLVEVYYQHKDRIIFLAWNVASVTDQPTADAIISSLTFSQ